MATPPIAYFGISTSTDVGDIKNIEVQYVEYPADGLNRFVRKTSGQRRQTADGAWREDGYVNGELVFNLFDRADLDDLVNTVLGGWTVASAERALSLMDEQGYYSPFLAHVGKPTFSTPVGGAYRLEVVFPLGNLRLQSTTKTAGYTVTADDRLIYCNTGSGSITLALPAAASINAYTIFSAVKTSASNNLVLDPNSTELINGASTYTLTANNARADIYSDGAQWLIKAPE